MASAAAECHVARAEDCKLLRVLKRLRMWNILNALSATRPKRATEVAREVGRYVYHVYYDLRELESLGFARQLPDKRWVTTCRGTTIELRDGYVLVYNCPADCGRARSGRSS